MVKSLCSNTRRFLSTRCCCFLPFCSFPSVWEKAWHILNREKVSLYWCLNDKLNWQEATESRRRGIECLRTCIMHIHSHLHRQEDTERTTPPTLAKHSLTWQIRMVASPPDFDIARICHISVRASLGFTSRQRNPKRTHVFPPLSLSILSCLSPLGSVGWSRNLEQKSTSHAA